MMLFAGQIIFCVFKKKSALLRYGTIKAQKQTADQRSAELRLWGIGDGYTFSKKGVSSLRRRTPRLSKCSSSGWASM